jgi:type I restriction enzyme S subunit
MKWQMLPFAKVAEVITGNTPSKKEPENYGYGIPWVKPHDLEAWEPITKTEETLSEIGQKKSRLIPPGSVMVCCIGSIGKVGIAGTKLATNQQINSLIFKPEIEPKFGYYYCCHILPIFKSEARQAVVSILNKSNFEKITIPVPTISEQRRIVQILDQADALRRRQAEADAKAKRILPALFIRMFGDPATNPMGWEEKKLSELDIDFRYGTSVKSDSISHGLPVLRIPNILGGEINLDVLKYGKLSSEETNRLLLQKGDLLFVRTNGNPDYVGRCAVFDLDEPYLFASYLIRARFPIDTIESRFIAAYLQTPSGRQGMLPFIRTTAGQSNISVEGLKNIPIFLPDIELQRNFVNQLDNLYKLRRQRKKSKSLLNSTFQILLSRAFSGELTAKWREAHMKELLAEMEEQAKALNLKDNGDYQ